MPSAREINGVAVSPGLALGAVHVVRAKPDEIPIWSVPEGDIPEEIGRLAQCVGDALEILERRQTLVSKEAGEKDAEIFSVHRMILQDPTALRNVETTIREERVNAEAAVKKLLAHFEATMGRLEGASVRGFAADVSDPWLLVLELLLRQDTEVIHTSDEKFVLAAAELTPHVVSSLERERILAVVAETGGRFSHGAVLARSFGVPCVVGLPNLLARLEQGMTVAVDGGRGIVKLRPDPEDIDDFLERRDRLMARLKELQETAHHPAITTDGEPFAVSVNIQSVRDLDTFEVGHTDGVGLLRTEFLYMERSEFPSEEEQYRMYRRVLERMEGRPVVIRTLDIGGDKQLPYFTTPKEVNPALGWRGLRISLQWRDLLRVQLRALMRASQHGQLRILLPMVTSLDEIRLTYEIFSGVRDSLLEQGYEIPDDVPVGIMVEVPSSLLALPTLIDHVDFVSVGTNDLVQYLLAVDRDNSWVAGLYDPLHPAVILALESVAKTARAAGKPCAVCGDMAGDAATALVLHGLGFDGLSVAPHFVPDIKYAVRRTSGEEARRYAREVLAQVTSTGVREVLSDIRDRLYDSDRSPSRI